MMSILFLKHCYAFSFIRLDNRERQTWSWTTESIWKLHSNPAGVLEENVRSNFSYMHKLYEFKARFKFKINLFINALNRWCFQELIVLWFYWRRLNVIHSLYKEIDLNLVTFVSALFSSDIFHKIWYNRIKDVKYLKRKLHINPYTCIYLQLFKYWFVICTY